MIKMMVMTIVTKMIVMTMTMIVMTMTGRMVQMWSHPLCQSCVTRATINCDQHPEIITFNLIKAMEIIAMQCIVMTQMMEAMIVMTYDINDEDATHRSSAES